MDTGNHVSGSLPPAWRAPNILVRNAATRLSGLTPGVPLVLLASLAWLAASLGLLLASLRLLLGLLLSLSLRLLAAQATPLRLLLAAALATLQSLPRKYLQHIHSHSPGRKLFHRPA